MSLLRKYTNQMNGIIDVYKPSGESSFQTVSKIKKLLKADKCGHTGTLDPLAEGVLPVCVNQATKFADYIMDSEKEYIAELHLGKRTDTMDKTGEILEERDECEIDEDSFQKLLINFTGEIDLKIPAFSAVKVNGERAYKLARKGELEDAGFRTSVIKEIELLNFKFPVVVLRVRCNKGTYIRSLIDKLGDESGCLAFMSGLVRSCNGPFHMKDSFTTEEIEECIANGNYHFLKNVNDILQWPVAVVKDEAVILLMNGNAPEKQEYLKLPLEEGENFFIENIKGEILAFGKKLEQSKKPLKIVKVFKDKL